MEPYIEPYIEDYTRDTLVTVEITIEIVTGEGKKEVRFEKIGRKEFRLNNYEYDLIRNELVPELFKEIS